MFRLPARFPFADSFWEFGPPAANLPTVLLKIPATDSYIDLAEPIFMFSAGAAPTAQPFEFFRRFRSELIQEANSGTYPNIIETSVYYKNDREFEVIFTVVSPITQAINQANAIVAQTASRVNMVIVYEGDPRPDEAEGAFFEDAGLSLVPA
ncbi:hypothetical protein V3M53_03295 [Trueperella pyogenes]|uniref:hypothetical protein n=1 Tax=Trueperella pyogenes TaxID=1661 RepID=UPI00345C7271